MLHTLGTPPRANATTLNITILDGNDNAPVFVGAPYSTTLQEGPVTTTQEVVTVNATDADSGSNGEIVYSIAGGFDGDFQLNPVTVSQVLHVVGK